MSRKAAPLVLTLALLLPGAACKRTQPEIRQPALDSAKQAAPEPENQIFTSETECMGTKCLIKIWHHDEALAKKATREALAEVERIEALMSDWREDSDVSRINKAAGTAAVTVAPETLAVIEKGVWLGSLTAGKFDITVGTFRGLWKFDEDKDGSLPTLADVKKRVALVDYRDIQIEGNAIKLRRAGQKITLGGIAKGYAVDAEVAALRKNGLNDFIVQAGGDLYAGGRRGDRRWMVGVQNPRRPRGEIIFKLSLTDRAFNTSGDYERFVIKDGKRYHHILDATTGFPVEHTRAVTLLATTAFKADLLDTALFTMGAEAAMKVVEADPDVEAVIIDAANKVFVSSGLKDLVKVADPADGL